MPEQFLITKRLIPLVVIEMLLSSALLTYWLHKKYAFDWIINIVIFFCAFGVLSALFFGVRIFRYLLSIAFSAFWGLLTWGILKGPPGSSTTSAWIAGGFVFLIALFLHKAYFITETESHRVRY